MSKDHSSVVIVDLASGVFVQHVSIGPRAWLQEKLRTLAAQVAEGSAELLAAVEAGDEVALEVRVTRRPPRIDL